MSTINETIIQLETQRARAEQEAGALTQAISALTALGTGSAPKAAPIAAAAKPAKKGAMSVAGRARIVAEQKKRWAKIMAGKPGAKKVAKRAVKGATKPPKKKRKMSPEAIAKIVAAQKARWAKIRADKAAPAA